MLLQVQGLAVKYERAEAAAKLEAELAVEESQAQLHAAWLAQQQLQQQLDMREQQTEARLAAAADALTAATAEIEQLSMQLLQAQQDLQQQREQRQQQQHDEVGWLLKDCTVWAVCTARSWHTSPVGRCSQHACPC